MKESILTKDLETCYICGRPADCIHHIYEGNGRRSVSDKNNFIVPLCSYCHNMSNNGVHLNKEKDLLLKRICQSTYEAQGHTREEFIKLIGRNYL